MTPIETRNEPVSLRSDGRMKLNFSYELPFGPEAVSESGAAVAHRVAGGWPRFTPMLRVSRCGGAGIRSAALRRRIGYGDRRHGLARQRLGLDPLSFWWDRAFNVTPVETIAQLGEKAGALRRSRQRQGNPNERGPWQLNENISIARTFAVHRTRLRVPLRGVQSAEPHDLGQPGLDNHQRQLRTDSRRWRTRRARCSSGCVWSSDASGLERGLGTRSRQLDFPRCWRPIQPKR